MNLMKQVLTQKQGIPFTQIANAVLEDKALSWKAKGIFGYLYSRPQDWDFSGLRIVSNAKDGRDATYAGLKELEEAGYLKRVRLSDGRMDYEIRYEPITDNPEKPFTEKPYDGKSLLRKSRKVSNKDSLTNKEPEKNKDNAKQSFASLPRVDSFFNATKLKERGDDGTVMSTNDFVLMCRSSPYRHIRLIGEYADERRPVFETRGQWRQFGKRNMQAARRLSPYTDRHLEKAMAAMEKDLKERGGFISKWGLETLEKYLDQTS